MPNNSGRCHLILEDGSNFEGYVFGAHRAVSGEVVFNTGMVGYPEALTDPSYKGQILVLTYPLIGNYGVPASNMDNGLEAAFESDRVQIAGLVVSEIVSQHNHWNATKSLPDWLSEQGVPGLSSVDTRKLTKRLREKGSMLGKLLVDGEDVEFSDPNRENLVSSASPRRRVLYPGGKKKVVVVDCGSKNSIIRSLLARGVTVITVPWNYNFLEEECDGVLISNGPGDPKMCSDTIANIRRALEKGYPTFGLCLGHQILALAAGADTYKMKFGHRSQNQPCIESQTERCYITSQNHGYAVDVDTLPSGWEPWFTNANDATNEGIRHRSQPFMSVQFHPEAAPGPVDAGFVFDEFLQRL